jgi:hypothetical protein
MEAKSFFLGAYLDEQQQVDILGLGSLTVLVANVVLLNVNTLLISVKSCSEKRERLFTVIS